MKRELRVLIVEDQVTDAELTEKELKGAGFNFINCRVETRETFEAALDSFAPDLIISDFSLPGAFDGLTALEIAQCKLPEVPFVLVSGTIGEERAVEAVKRGATDYVLKDRLSRLGPVVTRALREVEERSARRRAEAESSRQRAFLRQVIDVAPNFIFAKDREGRFVLVNRAVADAYGVTVEQLIGKSDADFNPNAEGVEHFRRVDLEVMDTLREVFTPEEKITDAAGRVRWLQTIKRPIISADGTADMVLGVATDITERKRGEEALRESEYRLDLALQASGLAVWDYDLVTGRVRFSPHWWSILGYESDETALRIDPWEQLTHADDLARLKAALAAHLKGSVPVLDAEYRMRAKSGEWRWIRTVGRVVERDAGGRAVRMTGTHGDITLRKRHEERIARLSRIHALLSGINALIVRGRERQPLLDEACEIAVRAGGFRMAWIGFVDPQSRDVVPAAKAGHEEGYLQIIRPSIDPDAPGEPGIAGHAMRTKRPAVLDDFANHPHAVQREEAFARGYRSAISLPLVVEDRAVGVMSLYATELGVFDDEEIKLLNELSGDVSFALEYVEKRKRLEHLANYDTLTGVANRNLLNDRLAQALAQAHRPKYMVAVALLDLDHFRLINDSRGHRTGDELLKIVASRLRACIRESDTLARLGGDEFVLILPGQTDVVTVSRVVERISNRMATDSRVVEILQRILDALSEPMLAGDRELRLTCSIGVSLYPQDGEDPEALLRNAAAALSRAKQLGRKNFQFYTVELNAQIAERLSLHSALRRALERDEFTLFYQPKISLQTGKMSGVEALLRWESPESGVVPPGGFIPVLEETGLIVDVGRRVMEKAVVEFALWRANSARPPRIAVNVSQLQLAQKDFPAVVQEILKKDPSGAAGLDIEITESLIMQDIDVNISKLKAIREMKVNIAIDDFGTGYSSLSYLAKLPIDTLKIDRAFIHRIADSPEGLSIVTTIISLAHSLGLKVVAEGVETEAQRKMLRLLKCDEIQGYVVSPPLSAEQFKHWWEHFSPQPTGPEV